MHIAYLGQSESPPQPPFEKQILIALGFLWGNPIPHSYHVVPDEVSERISDARGDEVRGVAEKDRAVCDGSISWFVQVRFLFLVRDRVSPSLQLHRVRCKVDAYHMLNS